MYDICAPDILLVDDEKLVVELYGFILEELGYAHTIAMSGSKAIELIKCRQFDLIITDLHMENDMLSAVPAGINVLKAAKEKNPLTKVIILSGDPDLQYLTEEQGQTADSYLIKPCPLEIFEQTIEEIIGAQIPVKHETASPGLNSAKICTM